MIADGDSSRIVCPSCAGTQLQRIGSLPDVQVFAGAHVDVPLPRCSLYRCAACRLKFRHPVLTAAQYALLYDNERSSVWQDTPSSRPDWALVAAYVAQHAGAGASILDFGCYTGGLLAQFGPGYSKFGVEVNARAREVAAQRTGAEVVPDLDSLPAGRHFDVVTAVDVVEHFPDPGRALESLLRITRAGGTLIVTTGDADALLWKVAGARWWYCFYPEHLAFISESWVRHWIPRSGVAAALLTAQRFRYAALPAPRYLLQACLAFVYFVAPPAYTWPLKMLKRLRGRGSNVQPPGLGLSKDHLFLAIRNVDTAG